MNTGENQRQAKIRTLKIVRRMIVIRKGVELLQKFCLFLQNMNEKFVNRGGGGRAWEGTFKKVKSGGGDGREGAPPETCYRAPNRLSPALTCEMRNAKPIATVPA